MSIYDMLKSYLKICHADGRQLDWQIGSLDEGGEFVVVNIQHLDLDVYITTYISSLDQSRVYNVEIFSGNDGIGEKYIKSFFDVIDYINRKGAKYEK